MHNVRKIKLSETFFESERIFRVRILSHKNQLSDLISNWRRFKWSLFIWNRFYCASLYLSLRFTWMRQLRFDADTLLYPMSIETDIGSCCALSALLCACVRAFLNWKSIWRIFDRAIHVDAFLKCTSMLATISRFIWMPSVNDPC